MKTCSSTKTFPVNRTRYFSQLLKTTLLSETRVLEYLLEFSSNNSRINCKICSKLTLETPDVVLVYLLLTLNIFDIFDMPDGILYCLNLNVSMGFKVGFRSRITFKTKFYVTTVNNSFQQLPIFCHKKLHLRCCTKFEWNIVM